MFTADGHDDVDTRRRIGMAVTRCGQLHFILGAENIARETKLRIYKSAVGSLFTYGSEAWCLNEKCLRTLNGANANCLHRFTGKTRIEEAREATCTYSLCKDIRRRRLAWLGHILRMQDTEKGEPRLVKVAVKVQRELDRGGNLLMSHNDFEDLVQAAADRRSWKNFSEKKFGRVTRKKKKTTKELISAQIGRWIGEGKDAIWVGTAPAPKKVHNPTF